MQKYYELEGPIIMKSTKNVIKIYQEHGKIQVFPRVDGTRHGIGRGATLDLESFSKEELKIVQELVNKAFEKQIH